ncbi:tetratricopeptide repeat protein [Sansalvadorimonas sp. 2012CJ34-2]|uniref:Tetratricopeptide repeat protein n=1 Tax=Parendozoicomonas callyspongiae TaxID=2942213 RepID=A0ABT0PKI2_9GAMM|nr:tetratricopeptide repeat protein [Sansalvadorimonas sp. 2012CJ34-2]MCL6271756.1 tetratricopeptide repeat protein [Sansalvadorimonas sp. 2012CJ34-2]
MKAYTSVIKPLLIGLFLLQLSGCTGLAPVSGQVGASYSYSQLESLTADNRPVAVQQLIFKGRTAWQEGKFDAGLVALDRALRISPDDALIYYYLASIRKEQGALKLSASLAKRGLSMGYNPVLRQQLQALLASSS